MTSFHDFRLIEMKMKFVVEKKKKKIDFLHVYVGSRSFLIAFIFLSFIFQFVKWKQRFNESYFLFL